MVYNVHTLSHLAGEVEAHGGLDSCAAWLFESYLYQVKKCIRSGKNPVVQLVKRLKEKQFATLPRYAVSPAVSVKSPDNRYVLQNGNCCEILEVQGDGHDDLLCCRVYKHKEPIFTEPCDSRILRFFKLRSALAEVQLVPCSTLDTKAIMIERGAWVYFLVLLHELD